MGTIKIKDADCNTHFMNVTGAGTEADPFRQIPADFIIEVSKGLVPGHSILPILAQSTDIGLTFTDVWDSPGVLAQATAAESWELVSANPADDVSGTGTRSVAITSLTPSFVTQTQVVDTNGGTASIPGTHIRPRISAGVSAGSNEVNVGDITIQVAGGGAIRNVIPADAGVSGNSHYTVPAGFSAAPLGIQPFAGKGIDIDVRTRARPFGSGSDRAVFSPGKLPIYQAGLLGVTPTPVFIAEKTDLWLQGKSTNIGKSMSSAFYMLIIDNDFMDPSLMALM